MFNKISIVMIAKNSEKTISKCLDSLSQFSDIVVYCNNSTDNTVNICKTYKNVNVINGDFLGFGETKNIASEYAINDWILSLDSDEVVSTILLDYLSTISLDFNKAYSVERINFYKKQQIKYCWKNDIVVRLYNKKNTKFNNNYVHESIIIDKSNEIKLVGYLEHYSYTSISDFINKMEHYSTLYADQSTTKKSVTPLTAILHSIFAFFKIYILKKGFLDGYVGLVISYTSASEKFYKYIKLYEKENELYEN